MTNDTREALADRLEDIIKLFDSIDGKTICVECDGGFIDDGIIVASDHIPALEEAKLMLGSPSPSADREALFEAIRSNVFATVYENVGGISDAVDAILALSPARSAGNQSGASAGPSTLAASVMTTDAASRRGEPDYDICGYRDSSDTPSVAGTEREALEETLHDRAYDAVKAIREHNGWTQVREFVEFYFSPWGAAKGALWEAITGDQPFNAEVAMQHIKGLLDGKSENPAQLAKDGGK